MGFIPVLTSIIFHLIFTGAHFADTSYWKKQIIVGIVFGLIAIAGTEFGIPIPGAVVNARDAAPLCAGLIFGAPAGIIAGAIGGIERWFAVYWGAGYYTRLACTISTILTGIIAGMAKRNIYEDRIPLWTHALVIGIVCEVIHMLMIFITNINDVKTAFFFVQACSFPMISVVSVSVAFAVAIISMMIADSEREKLYTKKAPLISAQFQKILLIVMLIGFVCSAGFTFYIQNRLSRKETYDLLSLNIVDVVNDVVAQSNEALLNTNRLVVRELEKDPDIDLNVLKDRFNVTEIDIIDKSGIITASSTPEYVGYDMASGEQSREFLCLLEGTEEFVQKYQTSSNDEHRKYSGIATADGFVQVAYGEQAFNEDLSNRLANIVTYRRIGETGSMLVIDSAGNIISRTTTSEEADASDYDIRLDPDDSQDLEIYRAVINGTNYYYMHTSTEGYMIYAVLPEEEADLSRNISTYLNQFSEIIVFGTLFAMTFFIVKFLIVDNVYKINDSLAEITEGNLDTVVDIRTNAEFISLSDGINTTVDTLKRFIAEANQRIDDELRYAKEIQSSALPSVFPAFPDHDEFDIYALMDPAKQVGGDFYDFYLLGKHKLVFLVADVAGKGIPASLFMMRSKTILKTYAENHISVADIFTNANFQLCEGNDAGMFVTAWMGFLDLETGELKYANAGHNKPLIRRKDGQFEFLEGPAGFVLGGMEGIVYKEQTMMLEPGDEIFLYTDGVVEATNAHKELYGNDRLLECANGIIGKDSKDLCTLIKEDVDRFYIDADQFDDITELSLQFKKYRSQG